MKLFQDAGEAEDGAMWCLPFIRSVHHYHDPIKPWDNAGYNYLILPRGKSSAKWAQDNTGGCNDYTWQKTLSHFRLGLTAPDTATRDAFLADLFSTLGHLTHLVADMSVPEHTRNDSHIWSRTKVPLLGFGVGYRNYEYWCNRNLPRLDSLAMEKEAFRHEFPPDNAIFAQSKSPVPGKPDEYYSPVSNLWDSYPPGNLYNPVTYWPQRLVGLADYSNFNYFSVSTVFDNTQYRFPARSETGLTLVAVLAKDGKTDYALYFNRTASDEVFVKYLASADLLYSELEWKDPADVFMKAKLDPYCWEDYASNLVPRAVSYGTALVDYFFRGKFEVMVVGSVVNHLL